MKPRVAFWLCCTLALGFCLSAAAVPVAPGETFEDDDLEFTPPTGTELASQSLPFTIEFTTLEGGPITDTVSGTLTNTVLRENGSAGLTVVYAIDVELEDEGKVKEEGVLAARGFANFLTNVDGDFGTNFGITRSADGAEVRAAGGTPGNIEAPIFIVRTDSTAFNAGGSLVYQTADEFNDPAAQDIVFGRGEFAFTGTYQPAAGDDPGTVIPLPAPFGLGLAGLGAVVAGRMRSRMKWARRA